MKLFLLNVVITLFFQTSLEARSIIDQADSLNKSSDILNTRFLEFSLWNTNPSESRQYAENISRPTKFYLASPSVEKIRRKIRNYLETSPVYNVTKGTSKLFTLADQSVIIFENEGTSQQTQIVHEKNGIKKTILKSSQFIKSGEQVVIPKSFTQVSSDQKYLSTGYYVNGATDFFNIVVYNLKTEKVIYNQEVRSIDNRLNYAWINANTILISTFNVRNTPGPSYNEGYFMATKLQFDQNDQIAMSSSEGFLDFGENFYIQTRYDNYSISHFSEVVSLSDGQPIYKGSMISQFLGRVGDKVFVNTFEAPTEYGVSSAVALTDSSGTQFKILQGRSSDESIYSSTLLSDNYILVFLESKGHFILRVFNLDGVVLNSILLPDLISADSVTQITTGPQNQMSVDLTLISPVARFKTQIQVDALNTLEKNKTLQLTPDQMHQLTTQGKYLFELKWAESFDHQPIPFMLVHLADLNRNVPQQLFHRSYPGFSILGAPIANKERFLVDQGYIVASSCVRGCTSQGQDWIFLRRKNNFIYDSAQDFNSVTQFLMDTHVSTPEKSSAWGGSDGGLLIGIASILKPELYARAFATSAVFDSIGMKGLEYSTWFIEKGFREQASDLENYSQLKIQSPIELIQKNQNLPEMFILSGFDDSRVNIFHSLKYASAVEKYAKNPQNIHFLIYPKSGHFFMNIYQLESGLDAWADFLTLEISKSGVPLKF